MHDKLEPNVIVVDLDGSLIETDILLESIFLFIRLFPYKILELCKSLFLGKASFKRFIADHVIPEVSNLPYNRKLLEWLKEKKAKSSKIVLSTASDIRVARKIADYLKIFDLVIGTEYINLSSYNKRDDLIARFGKGNFEYVGNSRDVLPVWAAASRIHVANPEIGVLKAISKIGKIENQFTSSHSYFSSLFKAMRIHQWAKNILIFLPLFAAHNFFESQNLLNGFIAFLSFGFCASSVYLLNDLFDLSDDREHPTKKNRPLAAGTISIKGILFLIPFFLLFSFTLSHLFLTAEFTLALLIYFFITLNYSLWIKRQAMLDVLTLAILYTLRVLAGAISMGLTATSWMLTFCVFLFLSLAFLKRYTEIRELRMRGQNEKTSGRGYYPVDFELLASLGVASGYISVLVLALYIADPSSLLVYKNPQWLWLEYPVLIFWISKLWIVAHRGDMHDDPIVFSLTNSTSLVAGTLFLFIYVLASYY